jgi:hypothetical protein
MVDLAGISGDTDLKGIRVFADVMQKTARGSRIANIEAAPKSASESASPPKMPFETFPCLERLAGATMRIKDAITETRHVFFLLNPYYHRLLRSDRHGPRSDYIVTLFWFPAHSRSNIARNSLPAKPREPPRPETSLLLNSTAICGPYAAPNNNPARRTERMRGGAAAGLAGVAPLDGDIGWRALPAP